METPNVNKLNGIPNFGHGLPEDGVVIAGVTDVPQPLQDLSESNISDNEEKVEGETDIAAPEDEAEENNGE